MNNTQFSLNGLLRTAVFLVLLAVAASPARADEPKLEAQLIWGANTQTSPDPKHKPAEAEVAKKLKSLPFKWSNYFEVNRKQFNVTQAEAKRVALSEECEITVRRGDKDILEVALFGRGKQVSKIKQALPKKEMLVLAGDAPDFTAWFVVLRQVE